MNNFKKITAAALAISFSFLGTSVVGESNVSFASSEVKELDLGVTLPGGPYREDIVTLNQSKATREEVMSYIRAIRKRAWDENAPYSADGYTIMNVQDLYDPNSDEGWQTSNKGYEYRFIYNEELEKLAIQRAYEYTLTNGDSQRPDGSSISTLKSENIGYDAVYELWAYDEIELTPKKSFDIWLNSKDEFGRTSYDNLVESDGFVNNHNYAAYNLVQDYPQEIGYGEVYNPNTEKSYAVLLMQPVDIQQYEVDKDTEYVGQYKMHIGNKNYKKSSKESLDRLEASVKKAKQTIAGAEVLIKSMPNFAEKNSNALNNLMENQRVVISKAEAILRANGR